MELVESPAEFGLIVNKINFLNAINLCGGLSAKLPRSLSSSRRTGETVRKSTLASALVQPTYRRYTADRLEMLRGKGDCESTPTLRNDASIRMVLGSFKVATYWLLNMLLK
jgi:hypothetical protein